MKHTLHPTIELDSSFQEQLKEAPRDIKLAFADALQLFAVEPDHESLHNHALRDRDARLLQY